MCICLVVQVWLQVFGSCVCVAEGGLVAGSGCECVLAAGAGGVVLAGVCWLCVCWLCLSAAGVKLSCALAVVAVSLIVVAVVCCI